MDPFSLNPLKATGHCHIGGTAGSEPDVPYEAFPMSLESFHVFICEIVIKKKIFQKGRRPFQKGCLKDVRPVTFKAGRPTFFSQGNIVYFKN